MIGKFAYPGGVAPGELLDLNQPASSMGLASSAIAKLALEIASGRERASQLGRQP